MNFKCVSWQLLRIEARAIEGNSDANDARRGFSSPLRLITNNGKCRIVIKKSHVGKPEKTYKFWLISTYLDGSLICGRMQTILEEVLWIVTLPQLRSAISFGKHILELIKKSAEPTSSIEKAVKSIVSSSYLRFCLLLKFRTLQKLSMNEIAQCRRNFPVSTSTSLQIICILQKRTYGCQTHTN